MISYYAMAFQGTLPIGSLLTGLVAHNLGAPLTVCLQGTAGIICAGLFIWGIRRRRQAQAQKPALEYSDIA